MLSPKLVGDKVGLHPDVDHLRSARLWQRVGASPGLIVAVPVASAIGVLLRFATKRYRESQIYLGTIPDGPGLIQSPDGNPQPVPMPRLS